MTSAELSPAPFAAPTVAPNDAVPSVSLPGLEYTLYQPNQLKSRFPALMIHGFATRGDQLYGGTGWSSPNTPPVLGGFYPGSANTCAPDTLY